MFRSNFIVRIVVLSACAIVVLQACLGGYQVFHAKAQNEARLQNIIAVTIRHLNSSLVPSLWDMEYANAEAIVRDAMLDPSFVGAEIKDQDSKIVFRLYSHDKEIKPVETFPADLIEQKGSFIKDEKAFSSYRFLFSDEENRKEFRDSLVNLLVSNTVVAIAIILILWWSLRRIIEMPVLQTARNLENIAAGEGDLTLRLDETRQDQIGVLSKWFNLFVKKLHGNLLSVSGQSDKLQRASDTMLHTANKIGNDSKTISTAIFSVANSTRESAIGIHNASDSLSQMSESFRNVATSVEEVSVSIQDVADGSHEDAKLSEVAKNRADSAKVVLQALDQATIEIGKMVDVIQDIAEQTNLLALNATIEAATAGEAGKGFAVVASEVKDLARQTTRATEEVGIQVENIRKASNESSKVFASITDSIDKIHSTTGRVVQSLEEQQTVIRSINHNISELSSNANSIASRVKSASRQLDEASVILLDVNSQASAVNTGIGLIQAESKDLAELAGSMQGIVGQFKL